MSVTVAVAVRMFVVFAVVMLLTVVVMRMCVLMCMTVCVFTHIIISIKSFSIFYHMQQIKAASVSR